MCFSARQVIGGVRWIVYEGTNAFTKHGAVNTEGATAAEWDVLAMSRSKVTAEEAMVLNNSDPECQGFTYDVKGGKYWKLTDVYPAGFRKNSPGFTVYVKEDAVKANAARRRAEHVKRHMLAQFDKYTGSEVWICYEFCNAYTENGAINIEGAVAEEWDAAAMRRPPTTLAQAKTLCDQERECHAFTYDPDNLRYWKLKDIEPRKFRKAHGHEYHVYVKQKYVTEYNNKLEKEKEESKRAEAAARMAKAQGARGTDMGIPRWVLDSNVVLDSRTGPPSVVPPPQHTEVDPMYAKAPPPPPPIFETSSGKGGSEGKGTAIPKAAPVSVPSKFEGGSLERTATTATGSGTAPAKGASKGKEQNLWSFRRKPKPEITECTITLRGNGPNKFVTGREDIVLDACQELAFIEGFNWPDYATIVDDHLCYVEWPDKEVCMSFVRATEGTFKVEEKTFSVKLPTARQKRPASEPAPDPSTGATALPEGTRVEITNLTGAKELNGKVALVHSFNDATGRYIVCLEGDGTTQKSLKPANLRHLRQALAAAKAKAAPAKRGAPTNLPQGAKVLIENLTGKDFFEIGATDMNGQIALVCSFDSEKGRYFVELEDEQGGIQYKVKPENLSPMDKEHKEMSELEMRKKRALGGSVRNSYDVDQALKGVNGDMWANFLNLYSGDEPKK